MTIELAISTCAPILAPCSIIELRMSEKWPMDAAPEIMLPEKKLSVSVLVVLSLVVKDERKVSNFAGKLSRSLSSHVSSSGRSNNNLIIASIELLIRQMLEIVLENYSAYRGQLIGLLSFVRCQ